MNPPSDDNYGCDYCSLLCLPTTPTILVMATRSGKIYHSLVIVDDEVEEDTVCWFVYKIILLLSSLTFFYFKVIIHKPKETIPLSLALLSDIVLSDKVYVKLGIYYRGFLFLNSPTALIYNSPLTQFRKPISWPV